MSEMTIAGLAEAAGVKVETVRFYQRRGLLAEPPKPLNGVRRYGVDAVARIRFVKSAQRLGFRLEEVADLLQLQDGLHCAEARTLAEEKLAEIRRRLADLRAMEEMLAQLVEQCQVSAGQVTCPLIAALDGAGR